MPNHNDYVSVELLFISAHCLLSFFFFLFLSFFLLAQQPQWARASSIIKFLDHSQRRSIVGRTPLGEWSARRRGLYLTTHNTHNRQTSMSPSGIRTHNLSRRAVADLRRRPRSHWDQHKSISTKPKTEYLGQLDDVSLRGMKFKPQ